MKEILTVSILNDNIKVFLEEAFGFLWIEGEVSNLRRPQSGHLYFTLKDERSQIRAVLFRQFGVSRYRFGKFELEDGMKILCRARLSAYPPRGEYQLIVESVEPQGAGALQKAFEQLKAKLAAEGLFDADHKKKPPFLPRRIGVVTSPTGAVIQDILNITRRRFPSVDILIAPARVQGQEAVVEIIAALRRLQRGDNVDVIIIARGGGTLEDLAPFNDECLARAIFCSKIPVISAIGHETDFTICDFVADLRAPTPSAAAELAVPQKSELLDKINNFQNSLLLTQRRRLKSYQNELLSLQARLKDPRRYLMDYSIALDDLRERMQRAFWQKTQRMDSQLRQLTLKMASVNPAVRMRENRISLRHAEINLHGAFAHLRRQYEEKLNNLAALISSLNPLAVLRRGYGVVRRQSNGEVVCRANQLTIQEKIGIQLAEGALEARVEKILGEKQ